VNWIILDGPVDSDWIESLNTVLDDNKTLTLANGDRFLMPPDLKLVFEVSSLANASPATVSRAGMIYLSGSTLNWRVCVKSWMKGRSDYCSLKIEALFTAHCESILHFLRERCEPKMELEQVNQMRTCLDLVTSLMESYPGLVEEEESATTDGVCQRIFVFSIAWGLGGVLPDKDRTSFHHFLLEKGLQVPTGSDSGSGNEDSIFDCALDPSCSWTPWSKMVPSARPPPRVFEFSEVFVPTVDSVRLSFLIRSLASRGRSVLIIGDPGVAKTSTLMDFLQTRDIDNDLWKVINFSSATSAYSFQRMVEGFVDKQVGNSYGPPAGKKLTIFVDDVNMPSLNEWGDQPTNELFRQLIECNGFYNLERPGEFKNVVDVNYLASMCCPGGGRNDIPSRLKRHFSTFYLTMASNRTMDYIFS
jgi:dynein heavy chain